jgi:multidrug efflux system outer membrane protein
MKRIAAFAAPAILVASCAAVGPDYTPPTMALSQHFVHGAMTPLPNVAAEPWWTGFDDPLLNDLVARGLSQNLSLGSARARIRQAEAALAGTGAVAQISGGLTADAGRQKDSSGDIEDRDALSASAAYIFDLFGGFRRGRQAASASLEAAQFDEGTVRLAYLGDILDAYINARHAQNAAWITRQAIESRRATLTLVRRQVEAGAATAFDVERAQTQLRRAEAVLPDQQASFEASVYRIATLLAEPAEPILRSLQHGARQPMPRRSAEQGVPADLLRNRPDVRAAERDLAAATAAIGIAEAQLYPSLTLSGTVVDGEDDTWSFGPRLTLPVLNQGVLRAGRNRAVAEASEAEIAWRAAVIDAVEQVQTAEAFTRNLRRQVEAQRNAAASADRLRALSRQSYENGESRLSDVLDADRQALEAELELAGGLRDLALSWVQLNVATGRGWAVGSAPVEIGG